MPILTLPSFLQNAGRALQVSLVLAVTGAGSAAMAAEPVKGGGATTAAPIYRDWARAFQASSQVEVRYEGTGSSDGQRRIISRELDFAGSDVPFTDAELKKLDLIQVPTLVGGLVPVANLPGVQRGELRLSGELLARIFWGDITRWDHADIKALNPQLALPSLPIARVVRSDASGSSMTLMRYLALYHSGIPAQAASTSVKWPGEVQAVKGSDNVREAVRKTKGAIAYLSYNHVSQEKLTEVSLRNKAGQFVMPNEGSFLSAVNAATQEESAGKPFKLVDQGGERSWPLTEVTYVLLPRVLNSQRPQSLQAARFFYWSFMQGDKLVRQTGFIPLPGRTQAKALSQFLLMKDEKGNNVDFVR